MSINAEVSLFSHKSRRRTSWKGGKRNAMQAAKISKFEIHAEQNLNYMNRTRSDSTERCVFFVTTFLAHCVSYEAC